MTGLPSQVVAGPGRSHYVRPTSVTDHSRTITPPLRTHVTSQASATAHLNDPSAMRLDDVPISGQPGSYRWIAAKNSPYSSYSVPETQYERYPTATSIALTSASANNGSYQSSEPSIPQLMTANLNSYMCVSSACAIPVLILTSNSSDELGTRIGQQPLQQPFQHPNLTYRLSQEEMLHTYAGQGNDNERLKDHIERQRYQKLSNIFPGTVANSTQ